MTENNHDSVISPQLSTASPGPAVAKSEPMSDETPVRIVKKYDRPVFRSKPSKEDVRRANRVELSYLQGQVKILNDRVRRLKEELRDELKMLTAALEQGTEETHDQVKRRISRLKGALEYQGRPDYTMKER